MTVIITIIIIIISVIITITITVITIITIICHITIIITTIIIITISVIITILSVIIIIITTITVIITIICHITIIITIIIIIISVIITISVTVTTIIVIISIITIITISCRSQKARPESTEFGRKIPPLKPKRNPNTQLSASFDEAYANRPSVMMASVALPRYNTTDSHRTMQGSDGEDEEPVYIEMVGDVLKGQNTPDEDSDESEAIYEEMKYPLLEDPGEPKGNGPTSPLHRHVHAKARREATRTPTPSLSKNSLCEIPPPFPNLLQHRPPLLAFPQALSQKSGYKLATGSTQLGSKLPVLQGGPPHPKDPPSTPVTPQVPGQQKGEKDLSTSQNMLYPSGRARSHSTPLPPQASGQQKSERELPTSHSMICPPGKTAAHSMLPVPQVSSHQKDKSLSYTMVCSTVKVTHSMLPASQSSEHKTEKDVSVLHSLLCSSSRSSTPCKPASLLYRTPTPHNLPDPQSVPPLGMLWTYPSTGLKRPPAYENFKAGGIPKSCSAVPEPTVKTQVQDRGAFASISCSRAITNSDSRGVSSPSEEGLYGLGWALQRKLSCSRKPKDSDSEYKNSQTAARYTIFFLSFFFFFYCGPSFSPGQGRPTPHITIWSFFSFLGSPLARGGSDLLPVPGGLIF
ncbi:neuronal tyrosine-phosphorylated phosphoinositide-3-kinase adapter 1-like [Latimeria chalumnae]|uniref:neuronal tyrosine-phosphorylated phosphoinositide-3-kinase adapter 1-like n=1 Tax=Latimeria chalumnae TaxID=7897 RepID=UPI00313E7305